MNIILLYFNTKYQARDWSKSQTGHQLVKNHFNSALWAILK